ncbi:MAG: type II toxin-antitoxin system RelE/ParE family toxin [Sphingobacteriales bacterium]
MFKVVFSKKANETFDLIQLQLLERWGVPIVIKFEQRTINVIATIAESPFIYQATGLDPEVRKAFIHGNCSLFYRVSGQEIVILFFWDNRQDPIF